MDSAVREISSFAAAAAGWSERLKARAPRPAPSAANNATRRTENSLRPGRKGIMQNLVFRASCWNLLFGVRNAQRESSNQVLSLVTIDWIKVEKRVIFVAHGSRAEVVDLSRLRVEVRERNDAVDPANPRLRIGTQVMLTRID